MVAQPDIAEVVATTDRSFYVRGIDVGVDQPPGLRTRRPAVEVIDVRVGYDAAGLERDLAPALPGEHIQRPTSARASC